MTKHQYITAEEAFRKADDYSINHQPFFIAVDFDLKRAIIYRLEEVPETIHFKTIGSSANHFTSEKALEYFDIMPASFETYKRGFDEVQCNIHQGNSYLLNYSAPSRIDTNLHLSDIYGVSRAKYKLLVNDEFVVFSPETFITIKQNKIATFPMKGTIDANTPNAKDVILSDKKEMAEHATIVDLLRNDLSQVANSVSVENYRYVDTVKTNHRDLLQVSSHIEGDLLPEYENKIGSVLSKLLPAGSVSGAPKPKTVDIIHAVEKESRNFYCGVMGVFDGKDFDSGVLIRYIEQTDRGLRYRSGGGITFKSSVQSEYNELKEKVYVPIA